MLTTTTSSSAPPPATNNEVPTPAPPREQPAPGGASPTAVLAVRSFATAYINWTASSVRDDLLRLAARSVGEARSAMTLAAAQTAGDYELHRSGIANSGTVEAIAALAGRPWQYVVVTRESTTAANSNAYAGLRAAWPPVLWRIARRRA